MKRILVGVLASLLSLILIAGGLVLWGKSAIETFASTPFKLTEHRELDVSKGMTARSIGKQLVEQGVMPDGWQFDWFVRMHPEYSGIRQGVYDIAPGDSPVSLFNKLLAGKVKDFSVTLVEGQTVREWATRLQGAERLKVGDAPFNAVLEAEGDKSGLPEGKFFPDTYSYHAGGTAEAMLTQSYRKMQQELNAAWAARKPNLPIKSPYELLILASIIEKETGQASERPLIAAVFVNRLRMGMRLQTDPTVIYGMGERFNGNITRKDLQEETRFNTYRINGLPPTPIAAPGRAALMAAAQPADVDYLYFVSRNDGSHVFSNTLNEHNRAVNQYQRKQK